MVRIGAILYIILYFEKKINILNMNIDTHIHVILILIIIIFDCVGSSLLCAGFLQLQQVGATVCCCTQASHCGGFSCCGAQALGARASVLAACGLSSCGTQALEHGVSVVEVHGLSCCGVWALWHVGSVVVARRLQSAGSVVVAHGFSCSKACGIFPDRGLNHVPCTGRRILNHRTTREGPIHVFKG